MAVRKGRTRKGRFVKGGRTARIEGRKGGLKTARLTAPCRRK